jgi:hypothetical protein
MEPLQVFKVFVLQGLLSGCIEQDIISPATQF